MVNPTFDNQVKTSLTEVLKLFEKYVAGTLEEANIVKLVQMLQHLPADKLTQVYQIGGMQLETTPFYQQNLSTSLVPPKLNSLMQNQLNATPNDPHSAATLHIQSINSKATDEYGLTDQQKMQKKVSSSNEEEDNSSQNINSTMANLNNLSANPDPVPTETTQNRLLPRRNSLQSQPVSNNNALRTARYAYQVGNRHSQLQKQVINQNVRKQSAINNGANTLHANTVNFANKKLTNRKIDANEDITNSKIDAQEQRVNKVLDNLEAQHNLVIDRNEEYNNQENNKKTFNNKKALANKENHAEMLPYNEKPNTLEKKTKHHYITPTPFKTILKPF